MRLSSIRGPLAGLAIACVTTCAIAAVNLPKEGNYDSFSCWTGTGNDIRWGKDYVATSYEMVGTVVSAIPNGLGDHSTFRCIGTHNIMKGVQSGGNYCEVTDPDGDKRMNRFEIKADGSIVREMIAGTGKYEGMTMTNTVALMPPMKDPKPGTFAGCNHQTGTYKLK